MPHKMVLMVQGTGHRAESGTQHIYDDHIKMKVHFDVIQA